MEKQNQGLNSTYDEAFANAAKELWDTTQERYPTWEEVDNFPTETQEEVAYSKCGPYYHWSLNEKKEVGKKAGTITTPKCPFKYSKSSYTEEPYLCIARANNHFHCTDPDDKRGYYPSGEVYFYYETDEADSNGKPHSCGGSHLAHGHYLGVLCAGLGKRISTEPMDVKGDMWWVWDTWTVGSVRYFQTFFNNNGLFARRKNYKILDPMKLLPKYQRRVDMMHDEYFRSGRVDKELFIYVYNNKVYEIAV